MNDKKYTCTNCGKRHEMLHPCPEDQKKNVLDSIFGSKTPETYEEHFDAIMKDATDVYEFQNGVGNPYAFHMAFEFAKKHVDALEEGQ